MSQQTRLALVAQKGNQSRSEQSPVFSATTRSHTPIISSRPCKAATHAPDEVIPVREHRNCSGGSLEACQPLCGMQPAAGGPPGVVMAAEQVGLVSFGAPCSPTRPSEHRTSLH